MVDTAERSVREGIDLHYADHPPPKDGDFVDFHVSIAPPSLLRRWLRPQIVFELDGHRPFNPLPRDQAYAQFEWGLNWCISVHMHRYLLIHAATLERDGRLILLPGSPGSGKSTLCAALASRGWRLFSDEMAVIDPGSLAVFPIPRPINLKNASIEIIREYAPDARLGEVVRDTTKGTVAHVSPSRESVLRQHETALPDWVFFPKYVAGSEVEISPMPASEGLLELAGNAFNYHIHGVRGFESLTRLAGRVRFARLRYSDLDRVIAAMEREVFGG